MAKLKMTENNVIREYTINLIILLTDIDEFANSVRKHWFIIGSVALVFGCDFSRGFFKGAKEQFYT